MPARKKEGSTRVRGNRASTAAVLAASDRPAPGLPSDVEWHGAVLDWWRDLWAAPMSGEYHESDVHQLLLLADLYQAYYTVPAEKITSKINLAGEIRLQRQAFGLTPYDRRRLEWQIETSETAKERGQQRRRTSTATPPAASNDPRSVALRVV